MKLGLEITVIWADEHLLEFRVSASNGNFVGQAEMYVRLNEFADLAKVINGFPKSLDDHRNYILGSPDTGAGGGLTKMEFCCVDSLGHAVVNVKIRGYPSPRPRRTSEAEFSIEVNPAEIDSFVRDLSRMKNEVGQSAFLQSS
jgi:hypothetical protein